MATGGRISTGNPKFRGAQAPIANPAVGQNVGGFSDAQVRINAWSQGNMLHKQLLSDKSASSPVPST